MDWQIPSGFDVLHGRQINLLKEEVDEVAERYDDYVYRMRKCRQFQFFGITPQWHPGEKDIEGFVHDEVVRQFHDTRVWDDGGVRIEQMMTAWHYAQGKERLTPTAEDIRVLGSMIEPKENKYGYRNVNVYIGNRMGVFPPYLAHCVELLASRAGDVLPGTASKGFVEWLSVEAFDEQVTDITSVDEWYLAFEWIHPFGDGNGRTGKVLHNWLNGTLDDPVLVKDYFGGGNP